MKTIKLVQFDTGEYLVDILFQIRPEYIWDAHITECCYGPKKNRKTSRFNGMVPPDYEFLDEF